MSKVKITINNEYTFHAMWEDNITAKTLLNKMPFTLKMSNLYGREMCHRFGAGSLPVKKSQDQNYKVGDISYWPPLGSLVILYKQNGEVFEQVKLGHIDEDVSIFEDLEKIEIKFEKEVN